MRVRSQVQAENTYLITASFEDTVTQPLSATAWAKTLDGQDYAACTTLQYGYKSAYNTTTLTVLVGGSEISTAVKSPEEMQKEAEQTGSLRIWHEFSWSFPFYRIHFVSVYKGADQYDQGMSPLPLVGATVTCSDTFLNLMSSLWSRVILPVAAAIAVAEFTALLASNTGPTGFIAALLISLGTKMGV